MSHLQIEVVFALPEKQWLRSLRVDTGTTVDAAIKISEIRNEVPESIAADCRIGVWGREVAPDYRLKDGDRIEIYRPLSLDPREARRQLALSGKTMRTAGSNNKTG